MRCIALKNYDAVAIEMNYGKPLILRASSKDGSTTAKTYKWSLKRLCAYLDNEFFYSLDKGYWIRKYNRS